MSPRIPDRANAGMHMARAATPELNCWLNRRDVLIVKADRREPLVVVRMSLAVAIATIARTAA
jgi:hypothetical protein